MFFPRTGQIALLAIALSVTPALASRTHHAPTSGHSKSTSKKKSKVHGQRVIDNERATQIQEALVREKYITGAPSGQWDAQTEAAMQRYQADNGWQTKIMPDSRALIKLGLGPSHENELKSSSAPAVAKPVESSPISARPASSPIANAPSSTVASVPSVANN